MSTARAHSRPSLIQRTTKDWPVRISPAANTPFWLVAKSCVATLPRSSSLIPN
ncbi:Uncharacterised protein [Vibrio cholerae]|nr:Uncharacterised protein [Vibrio cholerae]